MEQLQATSGLLLEAAVVILDVIIRSLLWLVITAALPSVVGLALTVGGHSDARAAVGAAGPSWSWRARLGAFYGSGTVVGVTSPQARG